MLVSVTALDMVVGMGMVVDSGAGAPFATLIFASASTSASAPVAGPVPGDPTPPSSPSFTTSAYAFGSGFKPGFCLTKSSFHSHVNAFCIRHAYRCARLWSRSLKYVLFDL